MLFQKVNRVVRVDVGSDNGVEWRIQREFVYLSNDVPDVSVLLGREFCPSETRIIM